MNKRIEYYLEELVSEQLSSVGDHRQVEGEAQPNCPTELQPFFESFPPVYPGGSTYEASVATLRGIGIQNGLDNRTSVTSNQ